MSAKKSNYKAAISLGIIFLIIGIVVTGIFYPYKDGLLSAVRDERKIEIAVNSNFVAQDIETIDIATSFHLNVLDSQDDQIYVKCNGTYVEWGLFNKIEKDAVVEGKTLNIDFHAYSLIAFFHYSELTLEVFIPVSFGGNLNVTATSGKSQVNLTAPLKKISFSQTSGENVTNVKAEEATFRLTSGSMNLQSVTANKVSVNLTSGSLKGTVSAPQSLGIVMTSGSANVSVKDFTTINARLTSGTMSLKAAEYPDVKANVSLTSGAFYNQYFEGYSERFTSDTVLKKGSDDGAKIIDISLTSGKATLAKYEIA